MNIQAHCKFCGRQVNLAIDDGFDTENLNKWVAMAACNPCADARMVLLATEDKIRGAIMGSATALRLDDRGAIETQLREKLTRHTKALAHVVCRYYGQPSIWDVDFVNQLMENQDRTKTVIRTYCEMIRRQAKSPHQVFK